MQEASVNCHTFSPTKSGKKFLTTELNSFWYVYSDSMGVLSNLTPVTISIQKSEVLKKMLLQLPFAIICWVMLV